jgi:hypothetical protein
VSGCEELVWQGCYEQGWGDLLPRAAYAHPAKFAYGLITRVVRFGLERKLWAPGDLVGDPFAGVGTGGLVCAYEGLRWLGVELEEKFVGLAGEVFARHRRAWEALKAPRPVVLQGDSRRFSEIVGAAQAVLTSPTYAGNGQDSGSDTHPERSTKQAGQSVSLRDGYGASPGQVGNESGETYWQAMRQIYGQCLSALEPGGTLCVVVKGYVKGGKLVDLPGQTRALLEHLGFRVFLEVKAALVREHREPGLFEPEVVRRRERKSFFRRLQERRPGAVRIDHEAVLFARREDLP